MALSQSEERALLNQRLESVLDTIAEALITSEFVDPEIVANNQKTINSGQLSLGRDSGNRLILYQKDVEANKNDMFIYAPDGEPLEVLELQILADMVNDIYAVQVSIMESQVGTYDITISQKNISNFKNSNKNVEYWIALEPESTYEA